MMTMKTLIMFAVLYLNLFICAVYSSKEIIVSSRPPSQDIRNCGTPKAPCKTLEYAVRWASKNDVIVLSCPHENRRYCQFNINNVVTVYYSVHIRSGENEKHIPQIYFKRPEPLKMRYLDTEMTFTNVTFHLTWAFGNAMQQNQAIVFDHCRFVLIKNNYILGVGKILQLVPVSDGADLKLTIKNSVMKHINDDPQKILLLLLSDFNKDDNKIDVTIIKTAFLGNIKIQLSSGQNRKVLIDGAQVINGTMTINGKSEDESWKSVEIKNAVFHSGSIPEQLSLGKLPLVTLTNVSFFGKPGVKLLQTFLCKKISLLNSQFHNGNVQILVGESAELQHTNFNQSNVLLGSLKTVSMVRIFTNHSQMDYDVIQKQTIKDSEFHRCSMKMFKVDNLKIEKVYFVTSLDEHTLNLVNCSKGKLKNSVISGKSIRLATSNVNIESCVFKETYGENGGAIYNEDSNVNVSNTKFVNTSAVYHGGAIYSRGVRSLHLKNAQFISSTSDLKDPALLGNIIYSDGPIGFESVSFDLMSSTNSPVIYIKTKGKEFMKCSDVTTVLGEFQLTCPFNHEMKTELRKSAISEECSGTMYELLSITCSVCSKGMYNPGRPIITNSENILSQEPKLTCKQCPNKEGETIIQNFQTKEEALNSSFHSSTEKSLPETCPEKTIYIVNNPVPVVGPKNPCDNNRTGAFCRICPEGFSTSLFSEKCVNKKEEEKYPKIVFWAVYIVLAIIYAIILMYIKELVVAFNIKGMYLEIRRLFKTLCVPYDADDFFYDDNQIHNIPDVINEEFDMVEVNHQQIEMTPLNFNIGTTTAVIKIIFFFYQVETLLRTTSSSKLEKEIFIYSMIRDTISSLLSLRIAFSVDRFVSIPKANLNEIEKEFIKDSGVIFLLLPVVVLGTLYLLTICCRRCNAKKAGDGGEPSQQKRKQKRKHDEDDDDNGNLQWKTSLLPVPEQEENPQQSAPAPPQQNNNNNPESAAVAAAAAAAATVPSPPPRPIRSSIKCSFDRIDGKVPIYVWMPLSYRVKCFVLLVTVLGYLPISVFLFRSIYCVNDGQQYFLVMQPTVSCFNGYNVVAFGLVLLWAIPFPLALYVLSKMQYTCKIVPREFFTALFFPPFLIYYFFRNRLCGHRRSCDVTNAMTAKHLLMVLYECFRLQKNDRRYDVMWEVIFVLRKLLLVVIAVCSPNQMRLYLMLIFLLLFLLHHIRMKPFSNPTMNGLESISLSVLCMLCVFNIFWTQQQTVASTANENAAFHNHVTQLVLLHIEYIILCFPVILIVVFLLVALVCFICNRTCCRNR